ncbi:PIF-1 [Aratus pisonii nudivirus]|nr:PIF-1 [Aratus pisonii nudivirus]
MDKSLKFFIVICIVFLIITIFLKISLYKFNKSFNDDLNYNIENENSLFKFAYDIYFYPPKDTIIIENPYNCTPSDLRSCKLSDPFSCEGCKSLIATCVNFTKDTKYIDVNGNELTITANTDPDDGYCLTQKNPLQLCNPYHGDLVLIQTDVDSVECTLYCECKNPGYIGKTEINGVCDEVFICNGKIDDLNKPLEQINCVCDEGYISEIVQDIPSCIKPMVKDFDGFDDPTYFQNLDTVNVDVFTDDISNIGHFPGNKLLNPCKYCLLTGVYMDNGKMVPTEDGGWQCALNFLKGGGIPIRRDPNRRLLKGAAGPDAVINLYINKLYIHGYLNETKFEQMTALIVTSEQINADVLKYIGVTVDKSNAFINLQNHQLVFPGSFGAMNISQFPGIACTGPQVILSPWDDFIYSCNFVNQIPSDRNPKNHNSYTMYYDSNTKFEAAPQCPPKKHSILTGNAFKEWEEYEGYNSAHQPKKVNELLKYEISQAFKSNSSIKYIFSVIDFTTQVSTHYGTSNTDIYNKWFAITIPKN